MPDEESAGKKDKPKCSGFLCSCVECGGRKRKETQAKKGTGKDA